MKKYISAGILSLLSFNVMAEGKWSLGANFGVGTTKIPATVNDIDTSGYTQPFRSYHLTKIDKR